MTSVQNFQTSGYRIGNRPRRLISSRCERSNRAVVRQSTIPFLVASALFPASASATAGVAEWSILTPFGLVIDHTDTHKGTDGTSLRSRDGRLLVAHLETWTFYPDFIAGETSEGFFLLEESVENVTRFESEGALDRALDQRALKNPISVRYDNAEGYREAWESRLEGRPSLTEVRTRMREFAKRQDPARRDAFEGGIMEGLLKATETYLGERHAFFQLLSRSMASYPEFTRLPQSSRARVEAYVSRRLRETFGG
jgi:hypothetical protein